MRADQLHVFTPRYNPLGWHKPHANWEAFATQMLASGVNLVVVECAPGDAPFACQTVPMADPSHAARFRHIGVRAKTRGWVKENLLNLAIQRVPEARYIAWVDGDILFRNPDWAAKTVFALQHYHVVQPWSDAYDLGPAGEHLAHQVAFSKQYFLRKPMLQTEGKAYVHGHPGYAWAMTRQAYDWTGGLFEVAAFGSADHIMSMAMIGLADRAVPSCATASYREAIMVWQEHAKNINRKIGFVPGTIEHLFHGPKVLRGYGKRDAMLANYDPVRDLKRNAYGVFEFACNKPELQHDFDLYLQSRNEDSGL